jgi:hypothetical protein
MYICDYWLMTLLQWTNGIWELCPWFICGRSVSWIEFVGHSRCGYQAYRMSPDFLWYIFACRAGRIRQTAVLELCRDTCNHDMLFGELFLWLLDRVEWNAWDRWIIQCHWKMWSRRYAPVHDIWTLILDGILQWIEEILEYCPGVKVYIRVHTIWYYMLTPTADCPCGSVRRSRCVAVIS